MYTDSPRLRTKNNKATYKLSQTKNTLYTVLALFYTMYTKIIITAQRIQTTLLDKIQIEYT